MNLWKVSLLEDENIIHWLEFFFILKFQIFYLLCSFICSISEGIFNCQQMGSKNLSNHFLHKYTFLYFILIYCGHNSPLCKLHSPNGSEQDCSISSANWFQMIGLFQSMCGGVSSLSRGERETWSPWSPQLRSLFLLSHAALSLAAKHMVTNTSAGRRHLNWTEMGRKVMTHCYFCNAMGSLCSF